jgi:hypothetical protein
MEPILTAAEMNEKRLMLQDYAPAQEAFAMLEKYNGRLDTCFDELWAENHNLESFAQPRSGKSLWQVTLKTLRADSAAMMACGPNSKTIPKILGVRLCLRD